MSEDNGELEHPLEVYTNYILNTPDYPLAKEGVLLSVIDRVGVDGEVGDVFNTDDPVICIAQWEDGTYCIGNCQNNVRSLFWSLDQMADPCDVIKVWLYYEVESFSAEWKWSPTTKPLYHAKRDGGTGWLTSEEQMSSESVGEGSEKAAPPDSFTGSINNG